MIRCVSTNILQQLFWSTNVGLQRSLVVWSLQHINPILVYHAQSSYMAFIRFYIEAWKFWLKLTIIFQICYSYHIFGCRLLSKPFLFGVHPTNINIKFPVYSMKRLFLFNQNTYLNLQTIINFQLNLIFMWRNKFVFISHNKYIW